MELKKTYWFTVAYGDIYLKSAARLRSNLKRFGINLNIISGSEQKSVDAKFQKIKGILTVPKEYNRIVFLDADTAVICPDALNIHDGAWKIPWDIPISACVPRGLDSDIYQERLLKLYSDEGLHVFLPGGIYEEIEWNSGVIVGQADMMKELALEWHVWWERILQVFDGHFRRDQISFRIAYWKIFIEKYNCSGLPQECNWVVSYFGINPNASVLHRTLVKGYDWIEKGWEKIISSLEKGEAIGTKNEIFDIAALLKGMPCLDFENCRHFNLDTAQKMLQKTFRYAEERNMVISSEIKRINKESSDFDVGCILGAHQLAYYEDLFKFRYVRFVNESFGVFSDSREILEWDYSNNDERNDNYG
jgi:hypothetical protein